MFPSEAYRELCIENQKELREEWERRGPQIGDWYIRMTDNKLVIAAQIVPEKLSNKIPLFQPRQLRQALESEGYAVCLTGPYMLPKNYQAILAKEDSEAIVEYGPDPATALLKAYLEMKEE